MQNYNDLNDYEIIYLISENDDDAKNLIFKKYYPVVKKEAYLLGKSAKKVGLEIEDLEQEGNIALFSALKHYNPNRNVLFYTYVVSAIRRKMLNIIRIHSADKQKILNSSLSLDCNIYDNDDSSLISFIEDKKINKPLDVLESKEWINNIKKYLYSLPIIESSVFELKLNGFKIMEISTLLDINRRMVNNLLIKIRKNLNLIIEK